MGISWGFIWKSRVFNVPLSCIQYNNIMATIYLTLSKKDDTNPQKEIRLRFKHGKIDQQAKTNIFIPVEHWDDEANQILVPNFRLLTDEKRELISYLNEQSDKLNTLVTVIQKTFNGADKNAIPTEWLKQVIGRFNFPEKYETKEAVPEISTVLQFTEKFIMEAPNRKDKSTGRLLVYNNIQQFKATEKHLKEYANSIGASDFRFSEINQTFYDGFVAFLQAKSFTQNTVGKHIKVLKTMLNDAVSQGYNDSTLYRSFHGFSEETDTIYLNESELQQLKGTDFSSVPHLDRVRDWFLLLAWTGCRFSDLSKISTTDIKDGFITFRQKKTNVRVTIPIHAVVMEILEKYEFNLPEPITNQKFNEYIKEACRIAEINGVETMTRTVGGKLVTEKFEKWERVSSHTGRRSFCTNMYKRGLPTLMIMAISGHRTEKSFLKYIKVKQDEHAQMMKKAWENMYKQTC